jgi:hypothetical protein
MHGGQGAKQLLSNVILQSLQQDDSTWVAKMLSLHPSLITPEGLRLFCQTAAVQLGALRRFGPKPLYDTKINPNSRGARAQSEEY